MFNSNLVKFLESSLPLESWENDEIKILDRLNSTRKFENSQKCNREAKEFKAKPNEILREYTKSRKKNGSTYD